MALGLLAFLATQLSFILFGVAFWFHPAARTRSLLVRLSLCFFAGMILFATGAIVLSLVGLSWGERTLPIPVLLVSLFLVRRWRRLPDSGSPRAWDCSPKAMAFFLPPLVVATSHLVMSAWWGTMTSTDFLFFWSTKAARSASARGIDPDFLRLPWAIHTHVNYPQLFPLSLSWSSLLVGDGMFRFGVLTAPIWFVLTIPLLAAILREAMRDEQMLAALTLWTVTMSCALVASGSGGNAEPPLIAYGSVALAAMLAGRGRESTSFLRLCCYLGLTGLLMTKLEGIVSFALLALGWLLREGLSRPTLRRAGRMFLPPLATASVWWLFELVRRTPFSDPVREGALQMSFAHLGEIFKGMVMHADAGTYGLAWIFAILLLAQSWRRWRQVLPALSVALGTLLFLLFYYLHARGNPEELIGWTMPRVSQPALAAAVLAAAFLQFDRRARRDPGHDPEAFPALP